MKCSAKMIATIITLVSLTVSVQAQTWNVPVYGCLQGRSQTAVIRNKDVLVRTGLPGLDQDMIEDITELNERFSVIVPLYFPNDELADAFFTPYKFPELIVRDDGDPDMPTTGSVFISMGLLKKEHRENYGNLMSIPAILAHEYAHAMQRSRNFPYEGKWRELHADFLAGWFIELRGRFLPTDPRPAFRSFYSKGDTGFFSQDPHGTKEERVSAMNEGYSYGYWANDGSGPNAYNAGLRYVGRLGAR